ncbi:hypothetical protein ACHAXA_011556 [Cyclostephanos tholiformis]|uniref:Phosphatidylinositol-glycan biosynthesis class W protein n=1 Tax=Cyclostephanos tholiformis TaxID=382380 RepID=A0ABD3R3M6_9STRA
MALLLLAAAPDDVDVDVDVLQAPRRYHDKENFVAGHDGTTPHEILLLCLVVPIGLYLHRRMAPHVVVAVDPSSSSSSSSSSSRGRKFLGGVTVGFVVFEFLTIVLPMLIVQVTPPMPMNGPCLLYAVMSLIALFMPSSMSPPPPPTPPPSSRVTMTTSTMTAPHLATLHHRTPRSSSSWGGRHYNNTISSHRRRRPSSLSMFRACLYVMTSIAILAVDFPIFPRRYCKTETRGYGYMDLGASGFVIVSGWTSALSGGSGGGGGTNDDVGTSGGGRRSRSTTALFKFVRKCAPLLSLGMLRLITTKGLEYQEHVTEYGLHWNFFFTLCCVESFMVVYKVITTNRRDRYMHRFHDDRIASSTSTATTGGVVRVAMLDCALALSLLVLYQIYLSGYGGQEFVESAERICHRDPSSSSYRRSWSLSICDVLFANREGIFGVLGYITLRLLSESFARWCLLQPADVVVSEDERDHYDDRMSLSRRRRRRLFVASAMLWIAHVVLTVGLGMPTSRRSTNAPFVLWSLAHNLSILFLIEAVMTPSGTLPGAAKDENGNAMRDEYYHDRRTNPLILEAVNRFGLPVFLISNLLTGLVNLTVDTLHSSDVIAMIIMSLYLGLVCGFALVLDSVFQRGKKLD